MYELLHISRPVLKKITKVIGQSAAQLFNGWVCVTSLLVHTNKQERPGMIESVVFGICPKGCH